MEIVHNSVAMPEDLDKATNISGAPTLTQAGTKELQGSSVTLCPASEEKALRTPNHQVIY